MPTQGAALGYERVGPSGRSLSERVNCDIIANNFILKMILHIQNMVLTQLSMQ
jgi:hypothetical protein